LLLPSTQKRSMTRNCGNRAWLAELQLLISTGEPTENVTAKYLIKDRPTCFEGCTSIYPCDQQRHLKYTIS